MNIDLSVTVIKTIARALNYCQAVAEYNRDNANGEVKDYYQRQVKNCSDAWQALYAEIDRVCENADEIITY